MAPRRFAFALSALLALASWFRFAMYPIAEKVCRVPDDGFYYLTLSRAFARTGTWTFDNGVSRTTGFHPLHAFVGAAIEKIVPGLSPDALLSTHAAIASVLLLGATWLVLLVVELRIGRNAAYGAAFIFCGGACLSCPLMAMEWPYALFGDVLVLFVLFRAREKRAAPASGASLAFAAFAAGFAVLARTDAIVPLACVVAAVFSTEHFAPGAPGECARLRSRPRVHLGVATAVGATVSYVLVALYVKALSGSFVQSSARMKTFWRMRDGRDPLRLLGTLTRSIPFGWWSIETPSTLATFIGLAVLLGAVVAAFVFARRASAKGMKLASSASTSMLHDGRELVIAALLMIAGTLSAYMFGLNGGQPWYTAHFIAPVAIVCGGGAVHLFRYTPSWMPRVVLFVFAALSFFVAAARIWPHQRLNVAAAAWVRENHLRGAAWNAGIEGFFSDGAIVNLDGLVNDDIHPYVFEAREHCYMAEKNIDAIVDADCTGRPESELQHWGGGPLREATTLEKSFGRVPDESACFVGAWKIDRDVLVRACGKRR